MRWGAPLLVLACVTGQPCNKEPAPLVPFSPLAKQGPPEPPPAVVPTPRCTTVPSVTVGKVDVRIVPYNVELSTYFMKRCMKDDAGSPGYCACLLLHLNDQQVDSATLRDLVVTDTSTQATDRAMKACQK